MPISDLDILRSANLLIRQRGDRAAEAARARSAELQALGKIDGAETYQRIVVAIIALQAAPSEAVN